MAKSTNVSIGCEATPEGRIKIFLVEGDLKPALICQPKMSLVLWLCFLRQPRKPPR